MSSSFLFSCFSILENFSGIEHVSGKADIAARSTDSQEKNRFAPYPLRIGKGWLETEFIYGIQGFQFDAGN